MQFILNALSASGSSKHSAALRQVHNRLLPPRVTRAW
jgi:hypothetical protein